MLRSAKYGDVPISVIPENLHNALYGLLDEELVLRRDAPASGSNGRVSRLLSTLMALQAGLPLLDFSGIKGKQRDAYFAAVRAGMGRNYAPMVEIFRKVVAASS